MRPFVIALVAVLVMACSGESSPRDGAGRRDGGARRSSGDAGQDDHRAAADGGARAAGAAMAYAGTLRGATEVPDGGLPDGGTAWHGEGTVRVEVAGEEATGRVASDGVTLEVSGNLAAGTLRAWLRAPSGQPRTEGVLLGKVEGQKLTGTWRTSGPGGAEVRAGTFEATR